MQISIITRAKDRRTPATGMIHANTIKRLFLTLVTLIGLQALAWADLGQTRKEIDQKYVLVPPVDWGNLTVFGPYGPNNGFYRYHGWDIAIHYNDKGIATKAQYWKNQNRPLTDDDLHWVLQANGVDPRLADYINLDDLILRSSEGEVQSSSLLKPIDGKVYASVDRSSGSDSHGKGYTIPIDIFMWLPLTPDDFKAIDEFNKNRTDSLDYLDRVERELGTYKSTPGPSPTP